MTRGRVPSIVPTAAAHALLALALVAATLTGCAGHTQSRPWRSETPAGPTLLAPSPVSADLPRRDPAVWAAVVFEQTHCGWDWHETRRTYLTEQQTLATAGYAIQLSAASDPVSWRDVVVAQKQTVTCTISDPARVVGAPSTAAAVYVRMTVNAEITSTLGAFAAGQRIASWLVTRTARGWLVAGSFEGG